MEATVGDSRGLERCCQYPGCTTKLSIYNSDFLCWTHADARTRARFERVTTSRARSEQTGQLATTQGRA
jgi:hypothetical protein